MALLPARLLVAFDAASVSGALLSSGLRGTRVGSLSRVPLPAGALTPSPFEANLTGPAAVREALGDVAHALAAAGRRASVILPDGVARTLLLEIPAGTDPVDFARFRLAPALPYPVDEAAVDVLDVGSGRFVAAAVRRSVVAEYEAAVAQVGVMQERLDLAPLAALAALRRGVGRSATVDVILGDAALSLAGYADGALLVFRSRRRDRGPGEAERLGVEVDRTAALAGNGASPRVRVVGTDAATLIRALSFGGRAAQPGWQTPAEGLPPEAAELPWFGAALA